MSTSALDPDTCCSLLPYFKVQPGKLAEFKALLPRFVEKTSGETKCLYYAFTLHGEVVHCREGYEDAAGLLAHLDNVGDLLGEALKIATLERLEVHGPAGELERLQEPLKGLNPQYFVLQPGGFRR